MSGTQKADAEITRFKEAAHCEMTKGRPDLSRPTAEPNAAAERAFRELFRVGVSLVAKPNALTANPNVIGLPQSGAIARSTHREIQ